MKRIICIVLTCIVLFLLCACSFNKPVCAQPGSFFSNDDRFILVDMGEGFSGRDCYIYADTVTGCMYLVGIGNSYNSPISFQLMNSDGTPMLYDPM